MKVLCTRAHGSTTCPDCGGTNYVDDPHSHAGRYECVACHGEGWVSSGCDGPLLCDDCGRSGLTDRPATCYSCRKSPDCKECGGSGLVTRVRGNCEACQGSGRQAQEACPACAGTRWVAGDLRLYDCYPCGTVSSEPIVRTCPKCRKPLTRLLSGKSLP